MSANFDLNSYDYELPERLIAQKPLALRHDSRLLVLDRKKNSWEHRHFHELSHFLSSNDVLVANNTRVIKARLLGKRLLDDHGDWVEGGRVEFVMLEERGPRVWEGLFHASAKYVAGLRFRIPTPDGLGLHGNLIQGSAESPSGTVVAEFDRDPLTCGAGEIPLPHYIERPADASDEDTYQTVYAKTPGSAAAPTAGLHFTDAVMRDLRDRGVGWEEVTLNVGLGTFRPVKSADIRAHVMHEERYEIAGDVTERLSSALGGGRKVVAVGTTSVRTLESAWDPASKVLRAGPGRTSIFIYPGSHEFQVVGGLITNFHLPRSTLLMLVSAFAGQELVLAAYREAVAKEYRFFSYGDAMLIL